jgi:hypothetical protein
MKATSHPCGRDTEGEYRSHLLEADLLEADLPLLPPWRPSRIARLSGLAGVKVVNSIEK